LIDVSVASEGRALAEAHCGTPSIDPTVKREVRIIRSV
jgi:hypothetical protein